MSQAHGEVMQTASRDARDTDLAHLGTIDRSADRPPYKQVADLLREQVANGRYGPGDRIPSEAELIAHFGLARMTIRAAIQELRLAGMVSSEHGRGVFVRTTGAGGRHGGLASQTGGAGDAIQHHLRQARSAAIAAKGSAVVESPEALLADAVDRLVSAVELLAVRGGLHEAATAPCVISAGLNEPVPSAGPGAGVSP